MRINKCWTNTIIQPVRLCVSGLMWPARQCMLQQGVSSSPVWHDPRWQGTQLGNRPATGRLKVPPSTSHVILNVSKKKTKWKRRPLSLFLWHTTLFFSLCQPQTRTLKEHQHSLTWQLRLSNAADWEQPLPEGEAPCGDCGFTIDERAFMSDSSLYPCRGKPSPRNKHVFMTLDAWLTANLLAFSYITGLFIALNAQTERVCSFKIAFDMREVLSCKKCHKDRLHTAQPTGSLTKKRDWTCIRQTHQEQRLA